MKIKGSGFAAVATKTGSLREALRRSPRKRVLKTVVAVWTPNFSAGMIRQLARSYFETSFSDRIVPG